MEDGIHYVKQIIFHSQTQIVSSSSVQFLKSLANLIRAWVLKKEKTKLIKKAVAYLQLF